MLKRDQGDENHDNHEQPRTPVSDSKRLRESIGSTSLQDLRTPLKTITGTILSGSGSYEFISPRRPGDEEEEKRRNRAELIKRQQESKEALRSPVSGASPRAEPLSSSLKRSTSGDKSGLIGSSPSLPSSAQSSNSSTHLKPQTAQGTRSILTASKSRLSLSTTRLSTIQPPTAEQMTKSFDEWMKMAADNKINSKNSWNFALIDYFSELTFLRDGDSINFQKASCTLDGCVKIYASRVDSVVDETTKLLNGLNDKNNKFSDKSIDEAGAEEDEDGNVLTSTSLLGQKTKTKKTSLRTVETIEKNSENLILKNFDLEFGIDPLFKKTSAEFDESGTKGSLLKNLQCSPIDNLVIFDSSDQIKMDFSISPDDQIVSTEEDEEFIDISLLSSIFGIDLDMKSLCPTFDDYTFTSSSDFNIKGTLDKLSRITADLPKNDQIISKSDVFEGNEDDSEDEGTVGNTSIRGIDLFIPNDDDGDYYEEDVINDQSNGVDLNEKEVETGAIKSFKWANDISDETGLSYFDGAFKQTWAGPEHWKIRKSQRNQTNNNTNTTTGNNNPMTNNSKTRKSTKVEKVAINFINSVIDFRQIFSKPTSSNQISLTKASIIERTENEHLLPDDLHFSSGSLLKLFIKPSWRMNSKTAPKIRTTRSSTASSETVNQSNFVERNFWISQENHQNGIFQDAPLENPHGLHENETSNFNQGDDDDYYDDADIGPLNAVENNDSFFSNYVDPPLEQVINQPVDFNNNLVEPPKFINAPKLNYARFAKRVDVAKLKTTLWNEFTEETKNNSKEESFSNLINGLSKNYSSEALAEVSVPYCFICLLHLANENNLDIKSEGNDLIIRK